MLDALASMALGGEGSVPSGVPSLPAEEVKTRLRAMGQPITYFGETDMER